MRVLEPAVPAPVPEELVPVPDAPAPAAWEGLLAELPLEPLVGAELDADELGTVELGAVELGAGGLALCDLDGLALCDGVAEAVFLGLGAGLLDGGVGVAQAVTVTVATAPWLVAALRLAGAGALVRGAPVEAPVAGGGTVTVVVTVGVTVVLGLAPPAGRALALPPEVLGVEPVDGTFKVTDWGDAAFEGDGDDVVGHGFTAGLLWPTVLLPGTTAPFDEFAGLAAVPCVPSVPPVLVEEIPVALPIWTRASRVGGSAKATPTANTAHAIARAGRSSPSRQSLGCCRADLSPSRPSRQVVQRRVMPARKPSVFPALACLLA